MEHPIFNTDHSDNCYCKICEKESERYLKALDAYKKPLEFEDIKVELYSKDYDNNFRLDIATRYTNVILNKEETKKIYEYLKQCLENE